MEEWSVETELQKYVERYRDGRYADNAEKRVTDWLSIFPPRERGTIANEIINILENTFVSREKTICQLEEWLLNPYRVSRAQIDSWSDAEFLWVQSAGNSQKTLRRLLRDAAQRLDFPNSSRTREIPLFVYVDDLAVYGTRIIKDLEPWIMHEAPDSFSLLILLQIQFVESRGWMRDCLIEKAEMVGKKANVEWWADEVFQLKDCYRPPFASRDNESGKFFTAGFYRDVLERALFNAGKAILESDERLRSKKNMKPLGASIWSNNVFGVPYVTWRNCPNSAPLAFWADGKVPALFPRECN